VGGLVSYVLVVLFWVRTSLRHACRQTERGQSRSDRTRTKLSAPYLQALLFFFACARMPVHGRAALLQERGDETIRHRRARPHHADAAAASNPAAVGIATKCKPSSHGRANRERATPEPRSTITASRSAHSLEAFSRGTMPAIRITGRPAGRPLLAVVAAHAPRRKQLLRSAPPSLWR